MSVADPELDVGRLVAGWTANRDLPGIDAVIRGSLRYLAEQGAPIPVGEGPGGVEAAVVTLPLVLRTWASNANVVSGAYHLSAVLDPSPVGRAVAVGVSVVAACFLRGRRDFVPDLIEALKHNEAPPELVAEARRAPIWARPDRAPSGPVESIGELFWALHHLGGTKAAAHLARCEASVGLLSGALVGARDGVGPSTLDFELEQVLDRLNGE